ncbi:hypothetical protein BH772_gp041 [Gordonia phage Bachita]|uniref:Uncharacterized protein n=1 Tax=Gordonia phage Bachita TaxID=1838061 RepID=A0A160DIA8_9CAUD|nr:hypothetical protein BH772_gp041 [Gordonia phage Bachita]ANA86844.1 hypothetical protein PBI_BACHITA_170 [Gordonia phage Bachita]
MSNVNLTKKVNLTKSIAGQHHVGSRDANRRFVSSNPKG